MTDCKFCQKNTGSGEPAASQAVPMEGRRFGRLVVVKLASMSPRTWLCNCDCGNTRIVIGDNLRRGLTRSCGCYARQRAGEVLRAGWKNYRESREGASNATAVH